MTRTHAWPLGATLGPPNTREQPQTTTPPGTRSPLRRAKYVTRRKQAQTPQRTHNARRGRDTRRLSLASGRSCHVSTPNWRAVVTVQICCDLGLVDHPSTTGLRENQRSLMAIGRRKSVKAQEPLRPSECPARTLSEQVR